MYAIQQIDIVVNKRKNGVLTVNLLSDPGSDATLVTFKTAKACNAVKRESVALQISTIREKSELNLDFQLKMGERISKGTMYQG